MRKEDYEMIFTLFHKKGKDDMELAFEGEKEKLASAFYHVLKNDPEARNIIMSAVVAYTEDLNNGKK